MSDNLRVLIVEDLYTDAELVEREVSRVLPNTRFFRVETEEEFLSALSSFRPDAILSDYKLPHFDGMSALKLAIEHAPETPVVIVTGSMNEDTAVDCMKAGAWDYVIKEHIKRLGAAVAGALDRKLLIRERGAAQEALRESEALFRNLFEHHVAVKLIIDPESGDIIDANRAAAQFYGWSREQLKHMRIQDLNTLSHEEVMKEMEKARSSERDYFEFRHRRADGSIRDVEVFSSEVEAGGRGVLHSIIHDVTERKRAEEDRERLAAAIEQAGEVVMVTDPEGTIQYVNPAFEKATGYSRQEAVGRNPRFLKSGEQDLAFYQELWQTISSGRTWQGTLVNRRKDGRLYTEEATISGVRDASGRIVSYVAVKRDITGQRLLEDQLRQAQKMESIGRLAGGVAHDFNNMLQVIISYVEMSLMKVDVSTPMQKYLLEIRRAAQRSAEITGQLLAFARRQTVSPKVLDLNDAVSGTQKMIQRLIGEDIDLAWMPGHDLGKVKIDPGQLDQILANLAVNARDAISGVGKLIIETEKAAFDEEYCATHSGFVPGEYLVLAVRDNGCGMDKETMSQIFEPFFTTKEEGKGTGLGLATVYGIVKQNSGFIDVSSEPGHGTTFEVYLPRVQETAPVEAEARIPAARGGTETVLVVEDEVAILELAGELLAQLGYKVLTARTPEEAMGRSAENAGAIHLLITDVVLPQMNGKQLAERLRASQPVMKCLFMSGYTADIIAHRGFLEEGVSFIAKPFSIATLAEKVRQVLDG